MIPYYRPYYNRAELLAALWPGAGRSEFESAFATRVGARYGIAFAYGRSGVIASLKALGLTSAEVILPAYTCAVMAEAVVASGNRPAFVDINLGDYNIDISALKRALTPQTRVVVAIHLYGYPVDVDAIRVTVGDERVIILEDSAQGLLTFSPGANGLRGDLGLFSFGPNKPISTIQGGVVVTNSPDLYERIRAYRDKEMNQSSSIAWAKRWARLLVSYLVFRTWAHGLWYRAKLTLSTLLQLNLSPETVPRDAATAYADFQARIGFVQLSKLDVMLARRRTLAELYSRELRDVPGICPAPLVDGATYSRYTLRISRRDETDFEKRMANCGIAVDRSYDYALPYLEQYRPFARGAYPRAAQAAREVINLPCYPDLQEAQARYIAACVRDCACAING